MCRPDTTVTPALPVMGPVTPRLPGIATAPAWLTTRVVFDESIAWPGAYAHVINSAFDIAAGKMKRGAQNCRVNPDGTIEATKTIQVGQELLQNYGRDYHLGMQ